MSTITLEQAFALALQQHQAGRLAEAETLYRKILAVQPQHVDALNLLGIIAHETGRGLLALDLVRQAVALRPSSAMFHQNLALVLMAQGEGEPAIAEYQHALSLRPDYPVAWDNLGCALLAQARPTEAAEAHRRALQLQPDFAWAHDHLGTALCFLRHFDEALASFQQALALAPEVPRIHDDYLTALQYQPDITPARLLAAHQDYERRHAGPGRAHWRPHANSREPDRPLRLGFVSPHFARHAVGHFLVRLLENLDRREFHVACYSDTPSSDATTTRLQAAADWHDTRALDDAALSERLRADGVDILFDLAGHTAGNRLLAFARKPAPIQITWLDYVGTTGLAAMDYILADARQIPAGDEVYYTEQVLRMPHDYICYDPPGDAPAVAPLPALRQGHVTFGSFNLTAKTSPQILETWARILHRVSGSRLRLKNLGWSDSVMQAQLRAAFAAQGIAPERVEFAGWSTSTEVLRCYHEIDIGLDTFPYNGGLTTCEALWMGVPVITCPGQTFAGRHGFTHLHAAGLPELIAGSLDDYVELAVGLATDLPRLTELRASLRSRLAASPLCDGSRFARDFAVLLRGVWRQWCASKVEAHV